jgi:hypothetical protein
MGFLGKLLKLTFIDPKDEATSASKVPIRKVRYAGWAVGVAAVVKAVANHYGYELPPEVEKWVTEATVALIFWVLYAVKPQKGEVENVTPPKAQEAAKAEVKEAKQAVVKAEKAAGELKK